MLHLNQQFGRLNYYILPHLIPIQCKSDIWATLCQPKIGFLLELLELGENINFHLKLGVLEPNLGQMQMLKKFYETDKLSDV